MSSPTRSPHDLPANPGDSPDGVNPSSALDPSGTATDPESNANDPVEELLARCLEGPETRWPATIEQICQDHPQHADELRRRLRTLRELGVTVPGEADAADTIPERLGDFTILRKLGSGGMGVVYLARQESLRREVALKLIRPDHLFFPGARERFRREVEAVSRLRHPGIVPVHLVGEERGVPYFAMEWLQGCTLADVLEDLAEHDLASLRGTTLAESVQRCTARVTGSTTPLPEGPLFEGNWVRTCLRIAHEVARTLHYAHGQGVLHRDVKPSNILLTLDGRVMLLDFGVASTTDVTRMTQTGTPVGSAPYMSPEQIDGQPIELDARIDVYSLGVTLYELLTMKLPYLGKGFDATRRLVLQGMPTAPRERNAAVGWDAETVTLTAMDADRRRRYASADEFAGDLDNVLSLRPVAARRPGLTLRARRWVQRHPTFSVGMGLGFLLVVVGPSVVAMMLRGKVEQVQAAEREARDRTRGAVETANFMIEVLTGADPFENPDPDLKVRDVLLRTAPSLEDRFHEEPLVRASLLMGVGRLYRNAGLPLKAQPLLEEAAELMTAEHGADSWAAIDARAEVVPLVLQLGDQERVIRMVDDLHEAVRAGGLLGPDLESEIYQARANRMVNLRIWKADALFNLARSEEAIALLKQVIQELRTTVHNDRLLTRSLSVLGTIHLDRDELDEAERLLRESVATARRVTGGLNLSEVRTRARLGILLANRGKHEEALRDLGETVRDAQAILDGPHSILAELWHNHAEILASQRRAHDALPYRRQSYDMFLELMGPNADTTAQVGIHLGNTLVDVGEYEEAERVLRTSLAKYEQFPDPKINGIGATSLGLAQALLGQGRIDEARAMRSRSSDDFATSGKLTPGANAILVDAQLDLADGQPESALPKAERALATRRRTLSDDHWEIFEAQRVLGQCHVELGNPEAAEPLLEQSFRGSHDVYGPACPETQASLRALIAFYEDQDRLDEAEPLWDLVQE